MVKMFSGGDNHENKNFRDFCRDNIGSVLKSGIFIPTCCGNPWEVASEPFVMFLLPLQQ
jgi:hypothetical protein